MRFLPSIFSQNTASGDAKSMPSDKMASSVQKVNVCVSGTDMNDATEAADISKSLGRLGLDEKPKYRKKQFGLSSTGIKRQSRRFSDSMDHEATTPNDIYSPNEHILYTPNAPNMVYDRSPIYDPNEYCYEVRNHISCNHMGHPIHRRRRSCAGFVEDSHLVAYNTDPKNREVLEYNEIIASQRSKPTPQDERTQRIRHVGVWMTTFTTLCRTALCVTVVGVLLFALCMAVYSLYTDIRQHELQRQATAAAAAALCRQQHRDNGCEKLNPIPPYLLGPCEEWRACMLSNPDSHGDRTKVAAAVLAQTINTFFEVLHWRTLLALSVFLLILVFTFNTLHDQNVKASYQYTDKDQQNHAIMPMHHPNSEITNASIDAMQNILRNQTEQLANQNGDESFLQQYILQQQMIMNYMLMLQQQKLREGQEYTDRAFVTEKSSRFWRILRMILPLFSNSVFRLLSFLWLGTATAVIYLYFFRNDVFKIV